MGVRFAHPAAAMDPPAEPVADDRPIPPEVLNPDLWYPPAEALPDVSELVTEDGAPVDNIHSEKTMRFLTEPLYSSWDPGYPFVALANVGVFFKEGTPAVVPDALLALHVRLPENLFPKINRSYYVWKYGRRPDVTIEIVSNKEGGEADEKVEKYAEIGVANYIINDPEFHLSDRVLRHFRLNGTRYEEQRVDDSLLLPDVGLGLKIWRGRFETTDGDWLRWTDLEGALIPTGAERAEAEAKRAEAEAKRANAEAERAAKLLEQLRRAGIEPE